MPIPLVFQGKIIENYFKKFHLSKFTFNVIYGPAKVGGLKSKHGSQVHFSFFNVQNMYI